MKQALVLLCATGCLISLCSLPAGADSRDSKVNEKNPIQFVKKTLGQSWAVVIAIDQYPNLSPLSYAVDDAKAVARMLAGQGFSVKSFYNTQATRKALLRELQHNLASRVRSNDRVLIFFAGHIGETGEDQPQGYVMPVDTDPGLLADTAIGMERLQEISQTLPAKQVLVLINMCYGGIEGRRMQSLSPMTTTHLRAITQEPARQIMTAGGTGQQALAGRKWNHSVFTHYLLEGLGKGYGDLNGDGIIPASELFAFLDEHVQSAALTHHHIQRPQMWSLSPEKGEFIFLTEGKASGSTVATIPKGGKTQTPEAGALERIAGLFKNLGNPLDMFKAPPIAQKQNSPSQTAGASKSERENFDVQAQQLLQEQQQREKRLAEQLAKARRLVAEEEERRVAAEQARQEQEALLARQQAALQAEKARLAAEEEQHQQALAELEEARRLAAEEERRRVDAEQARQEQEALLAQQQAALQAEQSRLAAEEEQRQQVLAELAEAQRLAAEEERRRVAAEQARREQEESLAKEQAAIKAEQARLAAEEARIKELLAQKEETQRAQLAEAQQLAAEEARQKQEELLAQQQAALQAEQARLAAEEEQRQQALAELAEARRRADEEERRRVAAEQVRQEQEALLAQERAALQAQQARLAAEEEQRQQALAELAEAQRLAAEEELRRVAAEQARQKQEVLLAQQQAALQAQQAKLAAEEEERRQAFAQKEQELQRQLEEARRLAAEAQAQQQRLAAEEEQRKKQLAEMEKNRQAQLAEAQRVAAEQARRAAEEQRKRELAEQEQARQMQLAEARRAAEEEQRQRELAEKERTRKIQLAEARRAAEEEQRKRELAEQEQARQRQQAEARRAAEEEQRQQELAEKERTRKIQLAEARRAAEEEQRKRELAEQERTRQRQLAEAQRAAAEQERKAAEARQRQQEAAEARRLADLEEERRRAAEEQARLAAEEEQRRQEEAAEARRLAALEEERRRAAAEKARQEQEAAIKAEQARKKPETSLADQPSKKNDNSASGGALQESPSATSNSLSSKKEETNQKEESSLFGFIKNLFNEDSSSIPEQPGAGSLSGITGTSVSPSDPLNYAESTDSPQVESPPEPVLEARLRPQDFSESFSPRPSGEDDAPMVLIPAGEFMMGSAPEQIRAYLQRFEGIPFDAFQAEIPQRPVALDAYYIDQYEVTYRLYSQFIEATGRKTPKFWKESPFHHPNHPVIGVTWDDAQAYCTWAGKRLPTEAEWEKAARGSQGWLYPWGNEWDSTRANTASFWAGTSFSSIAAWSDWMEKALEGKIAGTVEVGRFAHGTSPYGVHDMAGNVSEWVFDWYMPYENQPTLVHNPKGADSGTMKVHRGGSWSVSAIFARSAYRARENPESGNQYIGMRCAKSSK